MCTPVKQHAFCWGKLKEVLLEYDGKILQGVLNLAWRRHKTFQKKKKSDVCAWVWEESIYDLFQRIIPAVACNS